MQNPNAFGLALAHDESICAEILISGGVHERHWKVVIIGGGFGGLTASQHLKSDLVDVTLIDRRNYHLFQPLLYQVANGLLEPGEIAAPLRGVLSRPRKRRVLLGNVVDVDPNSEHVLLENGAIPCAEADANFGCSTRDRTSAVRRRVAH